MSLDVPNAYIQAAIPTPKSGEDRITMKLTGILVYWLLELEPDTYKKYVVIEKGVRTLYLIVSKAIYGMLIASVLWYKKFRADLLELGFQFNDYDPCVANRMVRGNQQTIRFYVDDVLSSHIDPKVNDRFLCEMNDLYGSLKKCTSTRGKTHNFLGMMLTFRSDGCLQVSMKDHIDDLLKSYPGAKGVASTPVSKSLFSIDDKSKFLNKEEKELFHSCVAKALFIAKCARPDIGMPISVLSSRVTNPNQSNKEKLIRVVRYLRGTRNIPLTLGINNMSVIKWAVDASYAVHPDFCLHSGGCMTWGRDCPIVLSSKQKINSRSSTESKLIAVDDCIDKVIWTKLFLGCQGINLSSNIIQQDNESTIKLEENGQWSAGKRSKALNIHYFFISDQISQGNVTVQYETTGEMLADFLMKPLQGSTFEEFRSRLMGCELRKNNSQEK